VSLSEKQSDALALELALFPHSETIESIAKKVGVTSRTFRRWRATDEYKEERSKRALDDDMDEIKSALRQAVLEKRDAALFKVWYDRYAGADETVLESILRMTDDEARQIAEEASEWINS
jgi:hypothetical protein